MAILRFFRGGGSGYPVPATLDPHMIKKTLSGPPDPRVNFAYVYLTKCPNTLSNHLNLVLLHTCLCSLACNFDFLL